MDKTNERARPRGDPPGRRRRRPTLWDVKDPPYGIPIPPPGSHADATPREFGLRSMPPPPVVPAASGAKGIVPGPHDIVRAPAAGESGPLAGIDIAALRALLAPRGFGAASTARAPMAGGYGMGGGSGGTLGAQGPLGSGGMSAGAGGVGGAAVPLGSPLHPTRHARRLYVGNLPVDTTDAQVGDFFNRALITAKGVEGEGNPVISVYLNLDKRFAFIETRSVSEAAAGLALDGVLFRGMSLRMRRPNDYNPSAAVAMEPPPGFDPSILGIVSTQVSDGPNKVFVGGIPYNLTEDQIKELLQSYGPLKAFNLIKEPNTGMSKGFAFFEFADPSVVTAACEGLNGMSIGDKTLTVRKASQSSGHGGATHASSGMGAIQGTAGIGAAAVGQATRILELRNVITDEELGDDEEYEDIRDDMEEEGRKFGALEKVVIPRPPATKGVGRVFLQYGSVADCERAFATMSGRRFDKRTVVASYFPEARFEAGDY